MNVYGESTYALVTIRRCVTSFEAEQSDLEDRHCPKLPITENLQANIELTGSLIEAYPEIPYAYLEEHTSLSRVTMKKLVEDKLNLIKPSSK